MKVKGLEKKAPLQAPILEAIRDPFIILSQKGEFIKVNPKGLEILGYSWEELQKMALIDVVVQEDHGNILHGCRRTMATSSMDVRRWGREERFTSRP